MSEILQPHRFSSSFRITQLRLVSLLVVFFCGTALLVAQRSFQIDSLRYQEVLSEWFDLRPYTQVSSELTGWPAIRRSSEPWGPLLDQGDGSWLRIPLHNVQPRPAALVLLLHRDDFTVWIEETPGSWVARRGGSLTPRSAWDSQQHLPRYSSPHTIQFRVPPQTMSTLYIQLGAFDWNTNLQPQLSNRSFFLAHSTAYFNRTIATQSVFHGALWVLLGFHLLMFGINRDRTYLFYAAYIGCISIHLFFAFEFHYLTAVAEYPRLSRGLLVGSLLGFGVFYALFLRTFLHQNGWQPIARKYLSLYVNIQLGIGGLVVLLLLLPIDVFPLGTGFWMLLPSTIIGLVGLLWLSYRYGQSQRRLARFIAATNVFLLCGLAVSFLVSFGGTLRWFEARQASFWAILFLEGTILLQLLSFALSLSYQGLQIERERTRLQELDVLKSRFFAQISHEFRTPLTLILGPIRQLKATINQPQNHKQLTIAERYAQHLLKMVNQILGLTKLQTQPTESLTPRRFDVVELARMITFSFESIAQEQQLELTFEANQTEWDVYLDQGKLEQILINLLSNAIKYNRPGGRVAVVINIQPNQQLQLEVIDTGMGIEQTALPYLFELYYQGPSADYETQQSSSGIGLAYTKGLVELQGGTITVESTVGEGTRFSVRLPLPALAGARSDELALLNEITPTALSVEPENPELIKEAPQLLIVEDHPDIRQYIRSCLEKQYQLQFAPDGEAGCELARQSVPDLILSDVMMPKMDGITLTGQLKMDPITSHIPIILLTGKSAHESRLAGLRAQADDYLTKPFDPEELQTRIHNLLENRKKWVAHFQQTNGAEEPVNRPLTLEEQFLRRVREVVDTHLADEGFGVEQLSRALHLERTQLFRKLKALTGQNPSEFIRVARLQEAHQLLQQRSATVAEIAFQVGFSSTSYFARSFKSHFGTTPGAVRDAAARD